MTDLLIKIIEQITQGNILVTVFAILVCFSIIVYLSYLLIKLFHTFNKKEHSNPDIVLNQLKMLLHLVEKIDTRFDKLSLDSKEKLDQYNNELMKTFVNLDKNISFVILNLESKLNNVVQTNNLGLQNEIEERIDKKLLELETTITKDINLIFSGHKTQITHSINDLKNKLEQLINLSEHSNNENLKMLEEMKSRYNLLQKEFQPLFNTSCIQPLKTIQNDNTDVSEK